MITFLSKEIFLCLSILHWEELHCKVKNYKGCLWTQIFHYCCFSPILMNGSNKVFLVVQYILHRQAKLVKQPFVAHGVKYTLDFV